MCDSIGLVGPKGSYFAMNSDRSCNEVQLLQWYEPKSSLDGKLKCTYMEIPQVNRTYGILISRPQWMWGAQMGVNQFGLCVGCNAVFTKGAYGKPALTGMDLVRLALERSKSAGEAYRVIVSLLEEHGQGGNCGYDHETFNDNSFLIMDSKDLFVLDTASKNWVVKRYDRVSISNKLSIGWDGDSYSSSRCNFASEHQDPLFNLLSGANQRQRITSEFLKNEIVDLDSLIKALRCHEGSKPFSKAMGKSPCMHAGPLVGDQTTASIAVDISSTATVVWFTGSSCPCVSTYKPYLMGFGDLFPIEDRYAYWMKQEKFNRDLLNKTLPSSFYNQKTELENSWKEGLEKLLFELGESQRKAQNIALQSIEELENSKLGKKARKDEEARSQMLEMEKEIKKNLQFEIREGFERKLKLFYREVESQDDLFYQKWSDKGISEKKTDLLFGLYWKKKNEALKAKN